MSGKITPKTNDFIKIDEELDALEKKEKTVGLTILEKIRQEQLMNEYLFFDYCIEDEEYYDKNEIEKKCKNCKHFKDGVCDFYD